jgi:hypothetical protein
MERVSGEEQRLFLYFALLMYPKGRKPPHRSSPKMPINAKEEKKDKALELRT